jgi:hypothetical protein
MADVLRKAKGGSKFAIVGCRSDTKSVPQTSNIAPNSSPEKHGDENSIPQPANITWYSIQRLEKQAELTAMLVHQYHAGSYLPKLYPVTAGPIHFLQDWRSLKVAWMHGVLKDRKSPQLHRFLRRVRRRIQEDGKGQQGRKYRN